MNLPEWLEKCRVPDDEFGRAYDSAPAACRAALKTGIALAAFHFGASPARQVSSIQDQNAGFAAECETWPSDWAMLAFAENCRAAARIAACAILPILAGVEQVFAVCAGRPGQELLTSLELCGVTDLFRLGPDCEDALLASLASGAGRILCLGSWQALARAAAEAAIPHRCEEREPRLRLADPEAFSEDVLRFCQGHVPPQDSALPDCVYAKAATCECSRLCLGPGLEGFWLYENLSPDFFRNHARRFGLIAGAE